MGRKAKVSPSQKLEAVDDYLCGNKSSAQICYKLNVTKKSFDQWVRKFKLHGAEGLKTTIKNTFYPGVSTMGRWRDFGELSNARCTICKSFIHMKN
ncbi:helix-turn-helix domain-containing protein [Clostridium sp. CH2]|uniref:helix-turn-helix domain-containing protein n=1 Tax=Clostridium sp. CH2 TaxID=2949990 RepID=UPI002079C49E|nr:helix-turn-helix domain-containing protein [Clostridium sp. CH2]